MAESLAPTKSVSTQDRVLSQEATLEVDLSAADAFLLFSPLAEKKWVAGWEPRFIFPPDGGIREKMVFLTEPRFAGESYYQWIVMKYDPLNYFVAYSVSTAERIWFVEVQCREHGRKSRATVRYTYVAITDDGAEKNAKALEQMFAKGLMDWQEAIHRYLGGSII